MVILDGQRECDVLENRKSVKFRNAAHKNAATFTATNGGIAAHRSSAKAPEGSLHLARVSTQNLNQRIDHTLVT